MIKSKTQLKFNHSRMHNDVIKKLNSIKKNKRWLAEERGISRVILNKVRKGEGIHLNTFIKICSWLENPVYEYIN